MDGEEFKKQRSNESVFKNQSSLDMSYVVPKLLGRDNVLYGLIYNFRRILEENEQPSINCLILGASGVGKTATVRFFGRNFKTIAVEKGINFFTEYYNCINFRSKSKIIRELLAKHTHDSGRGFSDEEALKRIMKQLKREKSYMLLIIDEAHILSPDDILSFLAINETFGHQNVKLSIILLSLSKEWMAVETTDILSKLNSTFNLKPYSFDDVQSILKYRSGLAFKKNVISWEILVMVSQIVSDHEDMRHGIEILRKSGLYADREGLDRISADFIREASNEVYPTFRAEIVDKLKVQELLTLLGIVRSLINRYDEPNTLVDDAFEEYQYISEQYSVEPHTKKTFRKYIKILSKLRIISSQMVRIEETERGRHLEISLIDITPEKLEDFLITIFDRKFGS